MRLLFLLLSLSVSLFATDYDGEIYTWGYGELIKNVLDSIHMLVNGNGLATLFKIAMGIGFLIFAFKKAIDPRANLAWEFGKLMLFATGVYFLFLRAPNDANHRYVITDKVTNQQWVVEEIPTGIGKPLSLITTFEDRLIGAMEKVFSLPNSISYRNSGFGFPLRDQYVLGQLSTPDIYFTQTFKEFIVNCTMNEIEDGSKDIKAIVTANNLLAALNPDGDSRLTKIYSQTDPDGKVVQCTDAYNYIVDFINTHNDNFVKLAAARLKTTPQTLLDRTNAVPQLFFNTGESARDYINQNFLINLTKTAFSAAAAESGLSSTQIAYATAIAKQNMQNKFAVSGILAREYIPIIKGVLLALIVALSWIMALFAVIHLDFRYISMYFTLLLWLMLWSPIFVILNYLGDTYVAKIFSQITNDTGQILTMYNFNFINSKVTNTLGWLGYLSWLVPPLAFAIAKASERGFVNFASSIAQTASAGAGAGAGAVTSKGTQATPEYRVGDTIYRDVPGGMQQLSYAYSGGHQFSITQTKTGGIDNVSANIDGGAAQAMASFAGGGVTSATFSSKNISANVSNALKSQAMQKLQEAKNQVESERHSYQSMVSGEVANQINSKDGLTLSTDKSMSLSERRALNQTWLNEVKHSIGNNTAYQKQYEKLQAAAASGSLGIKISKTGAGGEITFMDGNKVVGTIKLDEAHFKAFTEKWSQSVSKDLANNETLRRGFYHSLDKNELHNFSQSMRESEELSVAYSKLLSAQNELSYISEHGASITQNALSLLFRDELMDIKSKNPYISDKKAVELAADSILAYQKDGKLMEELKERGYLDINKPDISKVEDNVDKHINTDMKSNITQGINNIKDKIEKAGEGLTSKVNANSVTENELKDRFNKVAQHFHNSNVTASYQNRKLLNDVKKDVNKNIVGLADDAIHQLKTAKKDITEAFTSSLRAPVFEGLTYKSHGLFGLGYQDTIALKTSNGILDTGITKSQWENYVKSHPEIMDKIKANEGHYISMQDFFKVQEALVKSGDKQAVETLGNILSQKLPEHNPYATQSSFTDLSINTNLNQPSFLTGDFGLFGNQNKFTPPQRNDEVLERNTRRDDRPTEEANAQKPSDLIP